MTTAIYAALVILVTLLSLFVLDMAVQWWRTMFQAPPVNQHYAERARQNNSVRLSRPYDRPAAKGFERPTHTDTPKKDVN